MSFTAGRASRFGDLSFFLSLSRRRSFSFSFSRSRSFRSLSLSFSVFFGDGVLLSVLSFLSLLLLGGRGDFDSDFIFLTGVNVFIFGGGVWDNFRDFEGVGDGGLGGFTLFVSFLLVFSTLPWILGFFGVLSLCFLFSRSELLELSRFLTFFTFFRRASIEDELLEEDSSLLVLLSDELLELSDEGLLSFLVFFSFLCAFSIFICLSSSRFSSKRRCSRSSGSASSRLAASKCGSAGWRGAFACLRFASAARRFEGLVNVC